MSLAPVLILAGGTGGHVFPGLAVAAALQARAVPVVWMGSHSSMESRLVPERGITFHPVRISAFRGKGLVRALQAPFTLLRATWGAWRILRSVRPRSAISFGGYAAGPGGLAAWLLRIPLLVHEQNRIPGLTNRTLAKLAKRVLCGFPDSFPAGANVRYVGNPVRAEIAALAEPAQRFAGRAGALQLLVLGGSQGARALNLLLPRALALLPAVQRPQVRHQCGASMFEATRAAYATAAVDAQVEPFIADMASAYGQADLAVCRAGALTLAELSAAGLGALLIPFPYAVDDHQTRNGQWLVAAGAAELRSEAELTAELLAKLLEKYQTRSACLELAERARALARTGAAEVCAEQALEVAA